MKNLISFVLIATCLAFAPEVVAQEMSKKEKKAWKKQLKKLTPEQYKRLQDENKSLQGQVSSLKSELAKVDDRIAEKDEQIINYQSQVSDLRQELSRAQAAIAEKPKNVTPANTSGGGNIDENRGIVFKVQIGAFTKKDLSKYLDNAKNFSGEEEDGVRKYTIGVFRDYWEADTFKKYLREMGVKDAWIVSYKDGQRVPIKDVLEGVSKKS
jgi:hypothetical protein